MTKTDTKESPFDLAVRDAMINGIGIIVIHSTGVIDHIPPEEYLALAEALKNPPPRIKPLLKE